MQYFYDYLPLIGLLVLSLFNALSWFRAKSPASVQSEQNTATGDRMTLHVVNEILTPEQKLHETQLALTELRIMLPFEQDRRRLAENRVAALEARNAEQAALISTLTSDDTFAIKGDKVVVRGKVVGNLVSNESKQTVGSDKTQSMNIVYRTV